MRWRVEVKGGVLIITHGVISDAQAVMDLQHGVIQEGRWFITEADEYVPSVEMKAAQLQGLSESSNCCVLVGRMNGEVVGMVQIQGGLLRRMRHCGKLEIYVAAASRGQGVGRALMQTALEWATHNPVLTKIGLNVFAHNERAVGLYRSLGFKVEGHRPREYRLRDGRYLDDILMYRFCDAPEREVGFPAFDGD
ncbi:MAG: GNAT family N-acetyltransferase [Alphaproteobacteria bacterium]|nr:GNAT family N-acetyltransferase [Alphaproteobacteria bacterium]